MKDILAIVAVVWSAQAGAALAEVQIKPPDDRAALAHAETVVAGLFTGATEPRVREQPNALDRDGRTYTARVEFLAHEFVVSERLDGAPVPTSLAILVPGAVALPPTGQRVVVGLRAEGSRPSDGYNLLYGRALPAPSEARLDELRSLVQEVRAPAPISPEAIADSLGQLAAEVGAGPVVEAAPPPPVHDNPHPGAAAVSGPPRDAPREVQIQGDPRHPPEGGTMDDERPDALAPIRSGGAGALRSPSPIESTDGAAPDAERSLPWWLLTVIAALLLAAVALPARRRLAR
jgi:hypothetical protein